MLIKDLVESGLSTGTIASKSKTSFVILKIISILIQNRVLKRKFTLKPVGEKTKGIASLHGNI